MAYKPTDLLTFPAIALVLAAVALCWHVISSPAAPKSVDPLAALRYE